MGACFEVIFRMSLTASLVIAAVCLVRLVLLRAPRKYAYLLWLAVLIRLLCPAAVETRFGLIPDMEAVFGGNPAEGMQTAGAQNRSVNQTIADHDIPNGVPLITVQGTITVPDMSAVDGYAEWRAREGEAVHTADVGSGAAFGLGKWRIPEKAGNVIGWCWLCVCLFFLIYGISGYLRLIYRLRGNKKSDLGMEDSLCSAGAGRCFPVGRRRFRRVRVTEDAEVGVPFTVGLFRPLICLPEKLLPFQREMVLAHEAVHISRRDHFIKLLGFTARCIHWFNPLVWLAFRCFEEDMEISCDEEVLKRIGYGRRRDYAKTLLALSACRTGAAGFYPVSFGRKNTKARIRNALTVQKTKWWVALTAALLAAAALLFLSVDHKSGQPGQNKDLAAGAQGSAAEAAQTGSVRNGAAQAGQKLAQNEAEQREMEQTMLEWEEMLRQQTEDIGRMEEAIESEKRRLEEMIENTPDPAVDLQTVAGYILDGTVAEGELRLQDSDQFMQYKSETDRAVIEINADAACALLCNPVTGLCGEEYTMTYAYPVEGQWFCSSDYGCRLHPAEMSALFHSGMDFAVEKSTPVLAAAEGCVYRTGMDEENGNYVILIHKSGDCTYYTHCDSVIVEAGDMVACGQQIAVAGNTGKSTGAHLHFGVSWQGAFIQPRFLERGER